MQVVPQETINTNEFVVSVSPKGQITMPKRIRAILGVKSKDKVAIRLEQGEIKITPVKGTLESIYQMGGTLNEPLTDKEISQLAWEEHVQKVVGEGL